MTDAPALVLALLAGLALGAVFFGGLWWTVRHITEFAGSPFGFLGSLLLRMALVLGGFYWVGNGDWRRMCACLVGFLAARIVAARLARSTLATPAARAARPALPAECEARGRLGRGRP